MKFISTISLLLVASAAFSGELPELISLKTKIIKSQDWYIQQALLWKEEILKNSSEDALINYYIAARYAQWSVAELTLIQRTAETKNANSFANNLIRAWNGDFSQESYNSLTKAFEQKSDHPAVNALMVLHEEFRMNSEGRKISAERLWRNNGISSSLMNYTYNLLMSLENEAVLFTEGENTTLPLFLLQDVFNIRKDVLVLNLDLLMEKDYRQVKLKHAGLQLNFNDAPSNEPDQKRKLCSQLPEENSGRKFYYSLTLGQQNIAAIKDQLYVVGLASQISKNRFDNIALIRENLENRFLLDHLTVDFNGESQDATGKVLSSNYLVPMLLLSEHYSQAGELEKLENLQLYITDLAEASGKTLLVKNFLSRDRVSGQPFISANLNPKSLEDRFRVVKENIYASEGEVTNGEYQRFLDYLQINNRADLFQVSKIDLSKYDEPALSFMKGYHSNRVPTKKEKYFSNYPVVNISYEGAQAYCQWLTEQYNALAERKFKKVRFRLPAVNEFQIAALGYRKVQSWNLEENSIMMSIPKNTTDVLCPKCPTQLISFKDSDILYPWYTSYNYRNKVLNHKGCSLGNFKWPENVKPCKPQMPTPDGWMLMAPVASYFPNNIGLYDVVGNVAEMTGEKGKACGGSWNHSPEESTIKSINTYDGPDSAIGFRVFMEVIEK